MKFNRLQVYENPTGSKNPSDWNTTLLSTYEIAQMCNTIYNDKVLMQSICDCDFYSFALLMHLGTAEMPFEWEIRTLTLISKKYPQYVFVIEKYGGAEHLHCVATYYVNGYAQSTEGIIEKKYKPLKPGGWHVWKWVNP